MADFTQGIDLMKLIIGSGTILLENANLAIIDNFLSKGALTFETTPPGGAADDSMYIVGRTGAVGTEFEGHNNEIAFRLNGAWYFISAAQGTRLYVQAHKCTFVFDGTEWSGGWQANPIVWGNKTNGNLASTVSWADIGINSWKLADDEVIERVAGPNTHELRPLFDGMARAWFSGEIDCTSAGTLEIGIGWNTSPSLVGKRTLSLQTGDRVSVYVERMEISSGQNDEFRLQMRHLSGGFLLIDETAIFGCQLLGPS